MTADDEALLTRYLLGDEIPAVDRERLEERLFCDDAYFEELSALEDELINGYATGGLSSERRQLFEQRLATSVEWQREVAFTGALARAAGRIRSDRRRRSGWLSQFGLSRHSGWWDLRPAVAALAVVTCIFAAGGIWMAGTARRLELQMATLRAERDRLERRGRELETDLQQQRARADRLASGAESAGQDTRPPGPPAALQLVSLVLKPGLLRDAAGGPPRLRVPGRAEVRLQLVMPPEDAHLTYRAVLATLDGEERWSGGVSRRASSTETVAVQFSSAAVPPGAYRLSLSAIDGSQDLGEIASYYFSVER